MLPGDSSELPCRLITQHLVRLLRVASTLQELDAATFAIQARSPARPILQLSWDC